MAMDRANRNKMAPMKVNERKKPKTFFIVNSYNWVIINILSAINFF